MFPEISTGSSRMWRCCFAAAAAATVWLHCIVVVAVVVGKGKGQMINIRWKHIAEVLRVIIAVVVRWVAL